jgi:hypothetical protein
MSTKLSRLNAGLIPVRFDLPIYNEKGELVETVEHVSYRKPLTRQYLDSVQGFAGKSDVEILDACIIQTGFIEDDGTIIKPTTEFFSSLDCSIAGAWALALVNGETKKDSTV